MSLSPIRKKKSSFNTNNRQPGEVIYVGKKEAVSELETITYNATEYNRESDNWEDAKKQNNPDKVTWFNINGLNDTSKIEKLGEEFGLHPLLLEDIVNTQQRPKIEEHENYVFLVVKMLYHDSEGKFVKEHISIVLEKNYVLTFQEANEDVFDQLRNRIKNGKGRVRQHGSDYLMYSILDAIIDNYFVIIENLGDNIEFLEDELLIKTPRENISSEIQSLKRKILKIRNAVLPLREVIKQLEKDENTLINIKTKNYIRDLLDHILQIGENVEVYREMTWGLMDMYITTISNKMNEVMKVLTIMSSIFIPLTFIAGVYGMNFDYMPELRQHDAYFIVLGVMALIFLGMIWYFKRKKWF